MPTDPVPETTSEWLSERASRRRGAIAEDRVQAAADRSSSHRRSVPLTGDQINSSIRLVNPLQYSAVRKIPQER